MRRSNSAQRLLPSAEALAQRLGLGVDAYAWVFLTCLTPYAPDPGRVPAIVALQDLPLIGDVAHYAGQKLQCIDGLAALGPRTADLGLRPLDRLERFLETSSPNIRNMRIRAMRTPILD